MTRRRPPRRLLLHNAVFVDGQPRKHAGLTAVLEGLRKACPRVMSTRRL